MDQFKPEEIQRMEIGGNKACKAFFESSKEFDPLMTIAERYGAPFAEDYKEKLTAQIEGREWVPTPRKPATAAPLKKVSTAAIGNDSRSSSPARSLKGGPGGLGSEQKKQNEEYFSRLGSTNASRPDHLPPSQGGKFSGFGSTPDPPASGAGGNAENPLEDVAATISRGFWGFASTVTRAAKTANEQFIQPTAQKIAEAEITNVAMTRAATLGQKVSETAQYGVESARRYVDNTGRPGYKPVNAGGTGWQGGPDSDRRGFWDNFGAPEEDDDHEDERFYDRDQKSGALGTSAMRKSSSPTGVGSAAAVSAGAAGGGASSALKKTAKKDDGWEDW